MELMPPVRIPLARLPTPLERLERSGRAIGADVWIKRDDLTGLELTGNKVRKLEFLAAEAVARESDTLVTCGAVGSNHARATAFTAARLGMRSHLVLRGEDRDPPDGNLLLDRVLGAETTFITMAQWQDRDAILEDLAASLRAAGRRPYVIPEGGSNALGAMGYAVAVAELFEQEGTEGIRIRRLVHATGSAGTTAGIALGVAAAGRDDVEVIGVAVCDDRAYFDRRIGAILDECVARGHVPPPVRARARWEILDGFQGRGYAKTTPEEMIEQAEFARREGIVLDPVYTGKAWRGLAALARQRPVQHGATVFWHTGGLFGLFAFAGEVRALGR